MSEVRPLAIATKDIAENIEQSVQPRARDASYSTGFRLLNYLTSGNYRISPWWSQRRDGDLEDFVRSSDHLSSAVAMLVSKVATVPVKVEPRDMRMRKHRNDAEEYTIRLNEESEFGSGWHNTVARWLQDWWISDNGAFLEVIGDGDPLGPIEGPAMGIANLDSQRCQRTGDHEFPVLYYGLGGEVVKLHRSRVAFASDLPSAREEMCSVGYCAVSRVVNNAQTLVDIGNYKQEKLGSRPLRAILEGRGIATDAILDAIAIAEQQMDSKGFSVFSQIPVLGDMAPDASLALTSLVGLPDGYDEETSVRLAMFLIALGFGVPIRWLWPASSSGATKADAMYQHIAGLGGGVGHVLSSLTLLLGGDPRGPRHGMGKFLPPHLKLVFDFQDDEQDRSRAEIQGLRGRNRNSDLEKGVIDTRTARELALAADDISQSQFERMELADGRMPGGEPVLTLFHTTKEPFLSWLDLGVDNPLAVTANDPLDMLDEINLAAISVQDALANTSNVSRQEKAEQSLAALNELKGLYAPLAQQSVQSSLLGQSGAPQQMGGAPGAPAPGGGDEEAPGVPEELQSPGEEAEPGGEKQFNYGVSAGGIIGGQLARGAGGRFINAADLIASLQSAMLARLGKRGGATNSAATVRARNRAGVAEKLGVPGSVMDALAGMKGGETSTEDQQDLVSRGFATVNPDGSIATNNAGAALLRAGNSGDVDAAKQAKAKAEAPPKGAKPKAAAKPKAGAAPKPSKEQILAENRGKVRDDMGGRIGPEDFMALMQFADGEDLSPSQKQDLARQGLVEVDSDGFAKATAAGKTVIAASARGDTRGAKDALSRGAEQVEKVGRRVGDLRLMSEAYEERAAAAYPEAERQAERIQSQVEKAYISAERSLNRMNDQKESVVKRARQLDGEAQRLEEQASFYEQQAMGETDPIKAEKLQVYATRLREQSESATDKLQKSIRNLVDLERSSQDIVKTTEERVQDLTERAAGLLAQAEQNAAAWKLRAEQMADEADGLEASVGGGISSGSGLFDKAWGGIRRFFGSDEKRVDRVLPLGRPLPQLVDEILISDAEITAAVTSWNEDEGIPEEAKGVLEARPANLVEMVLALRDKPPRD